MRTKLSVNLAQGVFGFQFSVLGSQFSVFSSCLTADCQLLTANCRLPTILGGGSMSDAALADLHTLLVPILRHVLASIELPREGLALDLACGSGLKLPLLAEAAGAGVRFIALDNDSTAVHDVIGRRGEGMPAAYARAARRVPLLAGLVGDAAALPLRGNCCDAGFCIAALGLFSNPGAALCELRRVVRPGGPVLIVTATQLWAVVTRWPAAIEEQLVKVYHSALAEQIIPPEASPDLTGSLLDALKATGFTQAHGRAFLLGGTTSAERAELPLLPWPALRDVVAPYLPGGALDGYEARAEAEIELCSVALAAWSR